MKGQDYVFCPGIKTDQTYTKQSVEKISSPFLRYQAEGCLVWFEKKIKQRKVRLARCEGCMRLDNTIQTYHKRKSTETPTRKEKRTKVDSHVTISSLTPQSKIKRLESIKRARKALHQRVQKLETQLEHRNLLLSTKQSDEVSSFVSVINTDLKDELTEVFNEAGNNTAVLEQVWKRDSKKIEEQKAFNKDQHNVIASTGNRWSSITLRIALAVYHRSNSAYKALQSFGMLKLPSETTLKRRSKNFF